MGGGLQDFSVSPSPLGPNWVFELSWTGLRLGLGVLGTGLDNLSLWANFYNHTDLSLLLLLLYTLHTRTTEL